jgi:hypothetical protein
MASSPKEETTQIDEITTTDIKSCSTTAGSANLTI